MRLTESISMGIRAFSPAPTSINAPNFSKWVTRAGITSPGSKVSKNSALHRSCTARRERIAVKGPSSSR